MSWVPAPSTAVSLSGYRVINLPRANHSYGRRRLCPQWVEGCQRAFRRFFLAAYRASRASFRSASVGTGAAAFAATFAFAVAATSTAAFFLHQTAEGKIAVFFAADEAGWQLSVSDNGAGMPVGKKRGKPGLGTGIVEALSKQLDANVTVLDANPGTLVEVRHGQS